MVATVELSKWWLQHDSHTSVIYYKISAKYNWIKSYTWLISYNIWHSYVNYVEVITLKVLQSPPWLELRVILDWYLIIYDTRMWIMLKSSLWQFYSRHHHIRVSYIIRYQPSITLKSSHAGDRRTFKVMISTWFTYECYIL
jgi:hypothetical protein